MKFTLTDDGRKLIEIRNIESRVVTDDTKAATVFRNVLLDSLCKGKIKPRNEFGFKIDLLPHFNVNEDAVDDISEMAVREINRPRSITDFAQNVDPGKIRRQVKERLQREAKKNIKEAVLIGYVAKDDVIALLAEHGIECEWVSSPRTTSNIPQRYSGNDHQSKIQSNGLRRTHSTKERRNALDDVIDKAFSIHGLDHVAIWTQLVSWSQNQVHPLLGLNEDGEIKFQGNVFEKTFEPDTINKAALRERINRRTKKALASVDTLT